VEFSPSLMSYQLPLPVGNHMEFRGEEVSKMETVTCVTAIVCIIHLRNSYAFMLNPTQLLPVIG
jgi:hypothetical protein